MRMIDWFLRRFRQKENFPLRYNWRMTAYFKGTNIIYKVLEGHNLIVTVGKTLVGNMLIDLAAQWDTGLTYCALGSDNTAPAIGQTQLVDEGGGVAMRKTITSKTIVVNEITLSTFFTAAQSTLAVEEAAIFGSSTAGAGENSGVMFSRWLSSFDNSGALYDLTFDYVLTIG